MRFDPKTVKTVLCGLQRTRGGRRLHCHHRFARALASDGSDGSFSPGGLVRGAHVARVSARFRAVKASDAPSFPFGPSDRMGRNVHHSSHHEHSEGARSTFRAAAVKAMKAASEPPAATQ